MNFRLLPSWRGNSSPPWRSLLFLLLAGNSFAQTPAATPPDWREQGVIYLDRSLNARLRSLPVQAVSLNTGFWSTRRRVTTERSLPTLLAELEAHGVVDNFRRLAGRSDLPRKGRAACDADLYKWIEAASWALASPDTSPGEKAVLHGDIESLASHIAAAQDTDGYLDTYFAGDRARLRFTDLLHSHEDFVLGHLLQAGIAYYRSTGSRKLLDPGIRFADHVVASFGPDKRPFATGHPELEMALVELYRTTGQPKYLAFTRYLFSGAEQTRLKWRDADLRYTFSGRPFTARTEFEGHAVRALYAASGAADYFMEAGDPAFKKTLDLLWTDLTARKMYITGGVGARSAGESFGDPYELPSESAYAETCASVANVMWNFRLLLMTGNARYADVLERTLYNAVNAGMSLNGTQYCYRNPLATSGDRLRNPWYDVTCCPPNAERLLESLPGYLYAISRDGFYVNLYQSSQADWHLEDGSPLKVNQVTDYPWSGAVKLTVTPLKSQEFTMYLRWPSWSPAFSVQINGKPVDIAGAPGSYVPLSRQWTSGDVINVEMPMNPAVVAANPRVRDDFGRVALQRGPLVYALEQIDQNGAAITDLFYRSAAPVSVETRKDLLGGITVLKTGGQIAEKSLGDEPLYQRQATSASRPKRPVTLTYIPYYSVGNREPSPIEVWAPLSAGDIPSSSATIGHPARPGENK